MSSSYHASSSIFQSTLPARGATRWKTVPIKDRDLFQSTLPARGATAEQETQEYKDGISIHAPRTGSDNATSH